MAGISPGSAFPCPVIKRRPIPRELDSAPLPVGKIVPRGHGSPPESGDEQLQNAFLNLENTLASVEKILYS
ncbi:MAG: hypothetical protein ACREDV_05235, partial [Methylocella sp.]